MLIYTYTCSCRIHTDAMINRRAKILHNKIFASHFIARVRKGLLKVCAWEGAGDLTELKYFDPKLMAVSVVSFSFSRCSTGGRGVDSAGCWLSLLHLISIFSGPQLIRVSRGPPWPDAAFLTTLSSINPSPTVLQLPLDFCLDWVI